MAVLGTWMYDINTALDNPGMVSLLSQFEAHYGFSEEIDGVKICLPLRAGEPRPGTAPGR